MIDGEETPARSVARTATSGVARAPHVATDAVFIDMVEQLAVARDAQIAAGHTFAADDRMMNMQWITKLADGLVALATTETLSSPLVFQHRLLALAALALAGAESIERQYQRLVAP